MRRLIMGALVAAVCALSASATALASPPETLHHSGIVPARGTAAATAKPAGNLLYHGGAVLHANTTYAIYWVPSGYSVDATYVSTINGFFANVASVMSALNASPPFAQIHVSSTRVVVSVLPPITAVAQ